MNLFYPKMRCHNNLVIVSNLLSCLVGYGKQGSLSYSYSTGYVDTHSFAKELGLAVEQSFSYELVLRSRLRANLPGRAPRRRTPRQQSLASLNAPFEVPPGRIYEEKLTFDQQSYAVPYTLDVHVRGTINASTPIFI